MDLEGQLKKLEEITQRLESDDLPLEEAITLFEQGIKLASSVHTQLQKAKLRIEKVIETAQDTFSIEPLDLGSHGGRAVMGDGGSAVALLASSNRRAASNSFVSRR